MILIAGILIAAGCGKRGKESADSAQAASLRSQNAPPSPAGNARAGCVHTGLWASCSIERRLKQSGFVAIRRDSASKHDGFSVNGVEYSLAKSKLVVFIYKSEAAAAKDLAAIDSVLAGPRGKPATWESPPLLIRSANMAAVLVTQNARQAERLALALTAGPPQPGSSR